MSDADAGRPDRGMCEVCGGPTVHAKDPVRNHPVVIDRRLYGRRCLGCGLFVPDDEGLREAQEWRQ